jgi:uncharacterized membrane protein YdjX (TVP38/TMEM64 family)
MAASSGDGSTASSKTSTLSTVVKIVATVAVVALLMYLGQQAKPYVDGFREWIESRGVWAPVIYILGYAVATVAFLPGSILTAASGAIFGIALGTLYTLIGATLGSTAAFLIARYFARGWVKQKLQGKPRFAKIDNAIGKDGGKIVALLRLAPVLPYNLLNYALGLTSVRVGPYVAASIAMLPGTLLYVYVGSIVGQDEKSPLEWTYFGLGLLATAAAVYMITKKAKQAFDSAVDSPENEAAPQERNDD